MELELDRRHRRDVTIAAWRRAEARIYPSVTVNADLYRQYCDVVAAVADELRDVHEEAALVDVWEERWEVVREVVSRTAPPMLALMDLDAVRDAAFCHRHREVTREQGKLLARERLEDARRTGSEWVVLFDDVTPLGSHELEMHVRSGRAIHASTDLPLDARAPRYELQVVQLDPHDGSWVLDEPPLMPPTTYETHEEWEARRNEARVLFGKS